MGYERMIAGIFTGSGALMLIYLSFVYGEPLALASGTGLLGTMVGFFVGEKNGAANATKS